MTAASGSRPRSAARRGRSARGWQQATCGEDHAAPPRTAGAASTPGTRAAPRRGGAQKPLRPARHRRGRRRRRGPRGRLPRRARRGPYAFVRLPGRNPFLIDRLAAAYGVEVLDLRRPEELLAVCRERRLGLQEPVVEELLGAEALAERRRARARQRRDDALRVVAALLVVALACALALTMARAAPDRSGREVGHGAARRRRRGPSAPPTPPGARARSGRGSSRTRRSSRRRGRTSSTCGRCARRRAGSGSGRAARAAARPRRNTPCPPRGAPRGVR